MELYECGSEAVHDLQRIVSSTEGVWGSRFSGGGFGGCVVGLVEPAYAEKAVSEITSAYLDLHPEASDHAAVYLATSVKGVHFQ
jgi:galactokinase/galacturonokinase